MTAFKSEMKRIATQGGADDPLALADTLEKGLQQHRQYSKEPRGDLSISETMVMRLILALRTRPEVERKELADLLDECRLWMSNCDSSTWPPRHLLERIEAAGRALESREPQSRSET